MPTRISPSRARRISAPLRELQDWLEAQPEISVTTSIADIVMLLNRAFHDGDPACARDPRRGAHDARTALLRRRRRDAGLRRPEAAHGPRRRAFEGGRHGAGRRAPARASRSACARMPAGLHGRVTGDLVLLSRTVDEIARGQLESIGTALLTIYLTLSALLMSFRVGLIALLPNLLPIADLLRRARALRRAARARDEPDRLDRARHRGRRHRPLLHALQPGGAPCWAASTTPPSRRCAR